MPYPGYMTVGAITEIDRVEHPNSLRVRVFEFDGPCGETANALGYQEGSYTKDNNLLWGKFQIPADKKASDIINQYNVGDLVVVSYPTGQATSIFINGISKKAFEVDDATKRMLIGEDVISAAASQAGAIYPSVSGGASSGGYSASVGSGSGTGADLYIKEYKYYFGYPFETIHTVTSNFGNRPELGDYHMGIDIGAASNTNLYAVADGTVVDVVNRFAPDSGYLGFPLGDSYGNYIVLKHKIAGQIYYTRYAHLNGVADNIKIGVSVKGTQYIKKPGGGEEKQAGTLIGLSGHTGNSTGGHLHLEVLTGPSNSYPYGSYYGTAYDPRKFIKFEA